MKKLNIKSTDFPKTDKEHLKLEDGLYAVCRPVFGTDLDWYGIDNINGIGVVFLLDYDEAEALAEKIEKETGEKAEMKWVPFGVPYDLDE